MKKYVVNTTADSKGDHEVHDIDCHKVPAWYNQKELGYHSDCESAVKKAKETYSTANGCYHCSYACHTTYGIWYKSFPRQRTFLNRIYC